MSEKIGRMRAVGFERYGGPEVMRTVELPRPAPGAGEILVRAAAAAVNPADWRIRNGQFRFFMRLRPPFVPGGDLSGVVETVGAGVTRFRPGDAVYAMVPPMRGGAFAEYAVVRESHAARAPEGLSLGEAAAVPLAALTALQALRDRARVGPGQWVLVNGASGGVGTFAVQIAVALGARVVAACGARNLALALDLGAEEAVDYASGGLEGIVRRFDVVFDAVGVHPFRRLRHLLSPGGTMVTVNPGYADPVRAAWARLATGRRLKAVFVRPREGDLEKIGRWIAARRVRPVIERTLPLDAAAEALRLSEGGRVRGKLVLVADEELAARVPNDVPAPDVKEVA